MTAKIDLPPQVTSLSAVEEQAGRGTPHNGTPDDTPAQLARG